MRSPDRRLDRDSPRTGRAEPGGSRSNSVVFWAVMITHLGDSLANGALMSKITEISE